tara:strand:- start:100 stop:378 length:279 start_codon:yes stop_codon:yes gene_type:complete
MVSKLFVKTLKASIYLQQIVKHFSHKLQVEFDAQAGRIEFPFGIAELNAEELGLNIIAKAETSENLDKMKYVLASHLERFAFREKLKCNWDK